MNPIPRRTFLGGVAAAAVLAPAEATAAPFDAIHARVGLLQADWAHQVERVLAHLSADRPSDADPALRERILALGSGLAAISALKEVEQVDPHDQAHPAFQAFIHDIAEAVAGGLVACRELFEGFLEATRDDPDRETHLRAALRSARLGLADWPTTSGRQRSIEHSLLAIEAEQAPDALERRLRHEVRRIRRAEALADRVGGQVHGSGLFELRDPQVRARVEAGRAHWSATVETPSFSGDVERERRPGLIVLGIVVIGLAAWLGLVIVALGICALACGSPASGVVVLLLGLSIIGLGVWGGITLIRKGIGHPRDPVVLDDGRAPGPLEAASQHPVAVLAEEDWVPTPARRSADNVLLVYAVGLVRSPAGWMADADGNGVVASERALVPGAPVCALVGRIGGETFFLGSEGRVPDGPEGTLELAINRDGGVRGPKGHLAARVFVMEPARGA